MISVAIFVGLSLQQQDILFDRAVYSYVLPRLNPDRSYLVSRSSSDSNASSKGQEFVVTKLPDAYGSKVKAIAFRFRVTGEGRLAKIISDKTYLPAGKVPAKVLNILSSEFSNRLAFPYPINLRITDLDDQWSLNCTQEPHKYGADFSIRVHKKSLVSEFVWNH